MASTSPSLTYGAARSGKTMPPDADAAFARKLLQRAVRVIECRELGPTAARHAYGAFADTGTEPMTFVFDMDALAAHLGQDGELQALLRAVQARGPAVGVTMTEPPA